MEYVYSGSTRSIRFNSERRPLLERKTKQRSTAREFEQSLEHLLDDLSSSAASSCSDLHSAHGHHHGVVNGYARSFSAFTGSCNNLTVPGGMTSPHGSRSVRSCLNLALRSPTNPDYVASVTKSSVTNDDYKRHHPAVHKNLSDVTRRNGFNHGAFAVRTRPLSDNYSNYDARL